MSGAQEPFGSFWKKPNNVIMLLFPGGLAHGMRAYHQTFAIAECGSKMLVYAYAARGSMRHWLRGQFAYSGAQDLC